MTSEIKLRFFDQKPGKPDEVSVFAMRLSRDEDPAGYVAGKELTDAINAAILLGQPLLLTGEPGVGKTTVARAIADRLSLPLLEFTVKSTSRAVDLFYEYDAVGRFHAAEAERANAARLTAIKEHEKLATEVREQIKQQAAVEPHLDLLNYIKVRALGRAILNALPKDKVKLLVADPETHKPVGQRYVRPEAAAPGRWQDDHWPAEPTQSVVIIDEIDKAPSDFCNDLLDELDLMRFQVPELAIFDKAGDAPRFGGDLPLSLRPIVIITSNQERPLPDAFLRRCCYHHIEMPTGDTLNAVIQSRLGDHSRLSRETVDHSLRMLAEISKNVTVKRPGLAELLGWLRYIRFHRNGETAAYDIGADKPFLAQSLATLIKDKTDLQKVQAWLKTYKHK